MTDEFVYIPDLPSNILSDDPDKFIQNRLEANQQIQVKYVKCYVNLGVAVIRMNNQDDKDRLISNVGTMFLDSACTISISFVSQLETDSYIIIDQNISNIPSLQEVAQRYTKAYKPPMTPTCECISPQFPNIF